MTRSVPHVDSERRLLDAFQRVPAHVAILRGPSHVYEFVNDRMARVLNIVDPVGKPFGSSGHAASVGLLAILDRVRATGEPWVGKENLVAHRFPDGTQEDAFYNITFLPLHDDGGKVDGILIHSFDVTELVHAREEVVSELAERKRAEREHAELQAKLLQVQKLESLGVLAGGIAHDFNNLLAAVLGSVSVAALELRADSPAHAALRDALAAGHRAAQLTRQLLAYSGKGRTEVRPLDLSVQVRELAQLLRTTLPKKVELRLELPTDLPAILADVSQLQQIVMNLVINGAEAIDAERGVVHVTTGGCTLDDARATTLFAHGDVARGPCVFLEVRDTGCGMDDETKAKIFDPFFTTKFTGRGLGLAAVMGIVRAHHGGLSVESERGKGTTFTVYFPASDAAKEVGSETARDELRGAGLVLVVDDDDGVRSVLRRLLELLGFEVLDVREGGAALEAFAGRASAFVAVVLDLTMPGMGGEETMRELRRIRADVPIILTSGYDESEATRRFTLSAHAAFLEKPFTTQDLTRAMGRALGRS